jgi:hypothetical protein
MPPAPPRRDEAKLSPPLYAFYASCALVSLGAAIAASCWITFGERPIARRIAWVGVAMVVLGIAGAFWFLNRARTHETKREKTS